MSETMHDYYKTYKSEFVKSSGLPYYRKENGWNIKDLKDRGKILLSTSRCKKFKIPVAEKENVAGYKKVMQGYVPLYDRTGLVEVDKLFKEEIVSILE
jgi:hypothetical protein